ncbi:kelch-like protein 7 isoform X1 [Anabrus simplex]|uniref:kelch-like protein 7 isoform X1 n=1 Tax=Anabrus simplex TaxID=316456 RepID=UPI0035A31A66
MEGFHEHKRLASATMMPWCIGSWSFAFFLYYLSKNIESEAMKTLLDFIQNGEIPDDVLKSDHLLSLLQASMMLQFEAVQKICISVITQEWLSVETCLQTMATAHALDIIPLYQKARALALWEFSSVKSTSAFLDFAIEGLEDFLGNDHLNVNQGEFEVFDAGVTWIQEDCNNRRQFLHRILNCVRFSDVSISDIRTMFLYPCIAEDMQSLNALKCVLMLKENQTFSVTYEENFNPGGLSIENNSEVEDLEETELAASVCKRLRSECENKMGENCDISDTPVLGEEYVTQGCCCVGNSEESARCMCWGSSVEKSSPYERTRRNTWSSNSSPTAESENMCTNKSTVFDSETHAFAIQLMNKPRRKLPLVPCIVGHKLDGSADKLSGKTNIRPYVIYFDETETQQPIPFLHLAKVNEGPVEPSGYRVLNKGQDLYVIGGEYLLGYGNWNNTIWKYNIWKEEWIYETSLVSPRRHHSVCAMGDDIYIIGGFGRHRVITDSVHKYNIRTRHWQRCPSLPCGMYSVACCVHDGKIFVFGIEICFYEVKSESWHTFSTSPVPLNMTYNSALSHGEWIYLTGNYSPALVRFSPSRTLNYSANTEESSYELLGSFKYRPCSMCVVHHAIFCFTTNDQGRMFVEKFDIIGQNFEVLWEGMESEVNDISDFSPKHCIGCFSMIMY